MISFCDIILQVMGLRTKHKKIFAAIYENPVRANILWTDIESLFEALGAEISPGRGSRTRVSLNDRKALFHRPHPQKEANKLLVKSVRRFLTEAKAESNIDQMEAEEDKED